MSNIVEINCKYGNIKGSWLSDGMKINFLGALFDKDKRTLEIEFSFPFSFISKYGTQAVLEEIKSSVEGYIDTDPNKIRRACKLNCVTAH